MNRLLLLLILLLGLKDGIFAQSEDKPIRFFYRPSVGAMFPTRSFSANDISGNLIGTQFQNLFFQPLAIGFFGRNFGMEGQVTLSTARHPRNRHAQFVKNINLKYGSKYHTSIYSSAMADYLDNNSDPIVRGSLGPSYKVERNQLIFVGRMMVGVVSIINNSGRAQLKEKGTNELLNVRWDPRYPTKDCFSFHTSLTLAYRVSRRIAFNVDLDSWLYNADVTYKETTTNAVTGEVTSKKYGYKHLMNDISIGLGIMVVFK